MSILAQRNSHTSFAAASDRRSLSAYLEILMLEDCKRRGLLTPDGRLPKKKGAR